MCICPVLRPRQDRLVRTYNGIGAAPVLATTKAPREFRVFRGSIARPLHSLSTLRPGDCSVRTQDSLPAAVRSTGRDWLPAGFQRKVSELLLTSHPPFPSLPDAMPTAPLPPVRVATLRRKVRRSTKLIRPSGENPRSATHDRTCVGVAAAVRCSTSFGGVSSLVGHVAANGYGGPAGLRGEGKLTRDILKERPGWEMFRDGCPDGESPQDVAARADRFLARVRGIGGDVLAFSSARIIRMIAARWLGLPPGAGRSDPRLLPDWLGAIQQLEPNSARCWRALRP